VAGCCECGDEPSGSCATELVRLNIVSLQQHCGLSSRIELVAVAVLGLTKANCSAVASDICVSQQYSLLERAERRTDSVARPKQKKRTNSAQNS
jgi:hypothetical protein